MINIFLKNFIILTNIQEICIISKMKGRRVVNTFVQIIYIIIKIRRDLAHCPEEPHDA